MISCWEGNIDIFSKLALCCFWELHALRVCVQFWYSSWNKALDCISKAKQHPVWWQQCFNELQTNVPTFLTDIKICGHLWLLDQVISCGGAASKQLRLWFRHCYQLPLKLTSWKAYHLQLSITVMRSIIDDEESVWLNWLIISIPAMTNDATCIYECSNICRLMFHTGGTVAPNNTF